MNLTSLFGKQIFALYEGQTIGTISGATFNSGLNKVRSFKVFDNDDNELELFLTDIKAMSDFALVNNASKLRTNITIQNKEPMFKVVVSNEGKNLGKIIDAEILPDGTVEHYITSADFRIAPKNIYLRKDFVFFSETKINVSNLKPKNIQVNLTEIKVKILNETSENINFVPSKINYNPIVIVGKTAKSDLFGTNNEIIIKQNETITEKIIENASKHNRLNQLFYLAN